MPIERLAGYRYSCECGDTHEIATKHIVFGDNAYSRLPEILEGLAGKGARVLVIYSKQSEFLRDRLAGALKGFSADEVFAQSTLPDVGALNKFLTLGEDVRVIVGVGGGAHCDTVKYIAAALRRKCVLIADSVKCDAFFSPSCVVYQNGFKEIYRCGAPAAVLVDYDVVRRMDASAVAAAFGSLIAKNISLFDWKISNIITGEKHCRELAELAESLWGEALRLSEGARRRERSALLQLAELNLRSGLYMQLAASSRISCGGETHLEHALEMLFLHEKRALKHYGENLMLCAAFLARVYKSALSRDFGALLYPPDNNLRAENLAEFLGADATVALTKVRPLPEESVLRGRHYALREYREELLEEVTQIEARVAQGYKAFRRIYTDGGYGLTNYIDAADLRIALPLAPDIREKFTLLTMLKDLGLLDSYLLA